MTFPEKYSSVLAKADAIELALRRLNRWEKDPLPKEKLENMGAFGSGTLTFFQWLQFVLIERIHQIVKEQGTFPAQSNVAAFAVRELDGDTEADPLIQALRALDEFINSNSENPGDRGVLGSVADLPLPTVVYQLAEVLPTFKDEGLESQLQTFDMFFGSADEAGKKAVIQLLYSASDKTTSSKERLRIRKAAMAFEQGERAAEPYNHDEAMRKYQEEFKKGYPDAGAKE